MVVEPKRTLEVWTLERGQLIGPRPDVVTVEEPLEIRLDGSSLAVMMRTPGHDLELTAGLLLAEQLVRGGQDFRSIVHCEDSENVVEAHVAPHSQRARLKAERSMLTSSSCGLCGKRTIEDLHADAPAFASPPAFDPVVLAGLPARLSEGQAVFKETGGLHAAAVFDAAGQLLVLREDVGRHNAVDKCVGHLLLRDRLPVENGILVVSGRASFEIVQKALVARLPVVVAVSAPSSLAVELARASKMVLAGFARGERLNVYASGRA